MEPFFNTSIEILTSFRIKLKLISFSTLFTFLDGFPFFVFSQWFSRIQQWDVHGSKWFFKNSNYMYTGKEEYWRATKIPK